jgi:hypothetical protein
MHAVCFTFDYDFEASSGPCQVGDSGSFKSAQDCLPPRVSEKGKRKGKYIEVTSDGEKSLK